MRYPTYILSIKLNERINYYNIHTYNIYIIYVYNDLP